MKFTSRTFGLALFALLPFGILTGPSTAQNLIQSAGANAPFGSPARAEKVLVVDPAGGGQFTDLPAAIDAAREGALLLLKPGSYGAASITGKGLRLQAQTPGTVIFTGLLEVSSIGRRQEVHLDGLFFVEGFELRDCAGPIGLNACMAIDDGITGLAGAHVEYWTDVIRCGVGGSRHRIENCQSVALVDCYLEGRSQYTIPGCDGSPGEHGLSVIESRAAIYGGHFAGGNGSDGPGCHGGYGGAGGDGINARGATTRVIVAGATGHGGTGGIDLDFFFYNGCDGIEMRAQEAAEIEHSGLGHVTLDIDSLAVGGSLPSYTITGPAGADVFLMISPNRGWREFAALEGVLHMGPGTVTVPLGTLGTSGAMTRPFPAQLPRSRVQYLLSELQVYARVSGQDRYSEPRSVVSVRPGL